MLAVVKTRPEPGIEILDCPEPALSADDIAIVEVGACGVCGTDLHFYQWTPHLASMISFPRIIGHEIAGTVVEVGRSMTQFKPGDRVVADTWGGCGRCYYCRLGRFNHCLDQIRLGQKADGGMARYVAVPEISLFKIPEEMSFEEGAVAEVVGVALRCFERATLVPGDDVVVIGPGPVGLAAAMIADHAGAHRVIVLGLAADEVRLELARRLGYQVVLVDRENTVQAVREMTEGRGAEVVIEASGGRGALNLAVDLAQLGGKIGAIGLAPAEPFDCTRAQQKELAIFTSWRRVPSTWFRAINLVATRKVDVRPLVTHQFPVSRAEEAFELLLRREGIKAIITPE